LKLNIRGKLLLSFGIVLVIMLGTCLYLISNMKSIDAKYSSLINIRAKISMTTLKTQSDYLTAENSLRGYIITGESSSISKIKNAIDMGDEKFKSIKPLLTTEEGRNLYGDTEKKINIFKQFVQQIIPLIEAREASSGNDRITAEKKVLDFLNANKNTVNDLEASCKYFSDRQEKFLDSGNQQASIEVNSILRTSLIISLIIMLLGFILAYLVAQMISNPLRLVDSEAAKIAKGDLTGQAIAIRAKDETGRLSESFNTMQANLQDIVKQMQDKAQVVASSSTELSASAENVSAGATETASTISEVASTVQQIAANSQHIAYASSQASGFAKEGSEGLHNVVVQMDAIQQVATSAGKLIRELSEATGKITQIVDLITHIADQTNLLALNAAIEAARAGEHGRGFAVVAEEVRKLAEQSASAAKDIQSLIGNIQHESQKAVQGSEQNASQVAEGVKKVKEVRVIFEKIINAIQDLAEEINQVAAGTEEMSSSVQNVAAAAEEQTATMEEVASTTQNLTMLAEDLETLAKKFKLS